MICDIKEATLTTYLKISKASEFQIELCLSLTPSNLYSTHFLPSSFRLSVELIIRPFSCLNVCIIAESRVMLYFRIASQDVIVLNSFKWFKTIS